MVGRFDQQAGAFAARVDGRLSGDDAVCLGGDGFCQHYAVPLRYIAAYDCRDSAQIDIGAALQFFKGTPAKVSGVYVDVKKYFIHSSSIAVIVQPIKELRLHARSYKILQTS